MERKGSCDITSSFPANTNQSPRFVSFYIALRLTPSLHAPPYFKLPVSLRLINNRLLRVPPMVQAAFSNLFSKGPHRFSGLCSDDFNPLLKSFE